MGWKKALDWILPMSPARFYREALEFYQDKFHARVAVLFAFTIFIVPPMIYYAPAALMPQPGPETNLPQTPDDFTLVGVWLIIVPISMMILANYHLVMKPIMMKKKIGKNGRMTSDSRVFAYADRNSSLALLHRDNTLSSHLQPRLGPPQPDNRILDRNGRLRSRHNSPELCLARHQWNSRLGSIVDSRVSAGGPVNGTGDNLCLEPFPTSDISHLCHGMGN